MNEYFVKQEKLNRVRFLCSQKQRERNIEYNLKQP
jgi:hypothetical protein